MIISFLSITMMALTVSIGAEESSNHICMMGEVGSKCSRGCWNESDSKFSNGTRACVVVGFGHFSPHDDDCRYPCEPGTYSNTQNAERCTSCPGGSHASGSGHSECEICPPGTYSNIRGGTYCVPCDSKFYDGDGANSMEVFDGVAYCICNQCQKTMDPSSAPSKSTTILSIESFLSNSSAPTVSPTNNNDTFDEKKIIHLYDSNEESKCQERYRCPSEWNRVLQPVLVSLFLLSVIAFVHYLSIRCIQRNSEKPIDKPRPPSLSTASSALEETKSISDSDDLQSDAEIGDCTTFDSPESRHGHDEGETTDNEQINYMEMMHQAWSKMCQPCKMPVTT